MEYIEQVRRSSFRCNDCNNYKTRYCQSPKNVELCENFKSLYGTKTFSLSESNYDTLNRLSTRLAVSNEIFYWSLSSNYHSGVTDYMELLDMKYLHLEALEEYKNSDILL